MRSHGGTPVSPDEGEEEEPLLLTRKHACLAGNGNEYHSPDDGAVEVAVQRNLSADSEDSVVPFLEDSELEHQRSRELRRKRRRTAGPNRKDDARFLNWSLFLLSIFSFSCVLLLVDRSFFSSSTTVFESTSSVNSTQLP